MNSVIVRHPFNFVVWHEMATSDIPDAIVSAIADYASTHRALLLLGILSDHVRVTGGCGGRTAKITVELPVAGTPIELTTTEFEVPVVAESKDP